MPGTNGAGAQTQRDRCIRLMADEGCMGWQRTTGHGRRSHAGTTMGRTRHLIGPVLRTRTLPARRGEAALAVSVPSRMIQTVNRVSMRRL